MKLSVDRMKFVFQGEKNLQLKPNDSRIQCGYIQVKFIINASDSKFRTKEKLASTEEGIVTKFQT